MTGYGVEKVGEAAIGKFKTEENPLKYDATQYLWMRIQRIMIVICGIGGAEARFPWESCSQGNQFYMFDNYIFKSGAMKNKVDSDYISTQVRRHIDSDNHRQPF